MDSTQKALILNVQADPGTRHAVTRILEHEDFRVIEAGRGEEALRLAGERPAPDLILLDLHLADMSGLDVCRTLRGNPGTRSLPVLHLSTASVSIEEHTTALEAGADACLSEPVDPGFLVATVRALLRAYRREGRPEGPVGRWQAAFDAIGHPIGVFDRSGRIQQVNPAMCSLFDKTPDQLIGFAHTSLFGVAPPSEGGCPFERVVTERRAESAEIEFAGRFFHMTADPVLDDADEVIGAVCAFIDITERKRTEQERERLLQQNTDERGRLQAVVDSLPAGVIVAVAPAGTLVTANKQVEAMLGGPFRLGGGAEDYVQYPAFRLDGQPYRPEDHPLARTIANGETVMNEEMQIARSDGKRISILASSAPIRNAQGSVAAGVLMLDDVTEQQELQRQLQQTQKIEAMGRLAGAVAHDFNNLLTIIGGYGQMALDALNPKDRIRADIDAVMEAAGRASELTRQLLTFSRRQLAQPKVIDLNRHITRLARLLRRTLGERIRLKLELNADPCHIKGDPAQIEQVLVNLASNARDAMPDGGELTIATSNLEASADAPATQPKLKPGHYVLLTVTDAGSGMDAETQSHLFEPFFTTKKKGKGTGLGLSTVYGIVRQTGGEIRIDSELGRGTSVQIYLPLSEEQPRVPERRVRRGAHRVRGHETVLLVEDEVEVLRLTSEMLARLGYSVLEAASPKEALGIWGEHKEEIDFVLTDVIMPEMSGAELAKELKSSRPALKVIYMSGYTDEVLGKHGVLGTETAFLHKPFTPEMLARKIRSVLNEKNDS